MFPALKLLVVAAFASTLACTANTRPNVSYSFGLWGDMPYARNGDGAKDGIKMRRVIASMNSENLAFTVFDGDTKDGSSVCTDLTIGQEVRELFNQLKAPAIYVPGDNEWTDCHRRSNGGYNALERLDYLRKTLFANGLSFGQNPMPLQQQNQYPENVRWQKPGVVFVGLNVPGSNNNKVADDRCLNALSTRTRADCAADNAEYKARDAANIAYLHESFSIAKQQQAAGLVLVMQADPGFELSVTDHAADRKASGFDGYDAMLTELISEIQAFKGQVLVVHGDTHTYTLDKPFAHLSNFTRLETFGSPTLNWVKVSVDTRTPEVFNVQPMTVKGN